MHNVITKLYIWARAHQPESGQGVIEYALIIGLVSIVLAVALAAAGGEWIGAVTQEVSDALGV